MTVTTAQYNPIILPNEGRGVYHFELEIVGAEAFELWYIDGNEERTRAEVTEYTVSFNGNPPLYDSGDVTLTVDPPVGTVELSIERNTPIYQYVDFGNYTEFFLPMLEFTLDKATMIAQELAYRKCDAATTTEMTQLISFDPFTPLYASEVTFALDKLIAILNEIATSAEDCRDRLDET